MCKKNSDFVRKNFGNFICGLKFFEAKEMRSKILQVCSVSRTTYSYWLHGTRVPKPANKERINRIVKTYGYPTIY